jgi:DNA-binding NtrC family response regulator
MRDHLFALVVHDRREPFETWKRILRDLLVETYSVTTCKEAEALIAQCQPDIIFADRSVVDGSWVSIMNIAEAASVPLSVIVVAAHPDTQLYMCVMERGAFDFIAPPFEHEPLGFVTRSAALHTHTRREALAHAAVS